VLADDALRDGEAEAGAATLGREERDEQLLQTIAGDADVSGAWSRVRRSSMNF
jgi:hypothetical protein